MKIQQFAYFFMNDDGLRIHQIQDMLSEHDYYRIENCLRSGMPDYTDNDIAESALKYLSNPDYAPDMKDIPMMEGISNREIIDYLERLAKRCMETTIPAGFRPAICNVIRVIHKMWFRSWNKSRTNPQRL